MSLIVCAALATVALMRFAPGYFTDVRELDPQYASGARAALAEQQRHEASLLQLTTRVTKGWMHGDLGRSRQFDVPVTELVAARAGQSVRLLLSGTALGWLFAFGAAVLAGVRRPRRADTWAEPLIALPSALLLAIPVGALATLCLFTNTGGALLVLAVAVGVRDFKLIYRLLRRTIESPYLLYARALGMPTRRIVRMHLLPAVASELFALATMSFVLALSALVPVEVLFDVPGLGQLAWAAAMNRDLPVLLAVTLVMALAVGVAGLFTGSAPVGETRHLESHTDRAFAVESL